MEKITRVILILMLCYPLLSFAVGIRNVVGEHFRMFGEPRIYRFYGLDNYLLSLPEIASFPIDPGRDTVYVIYAEDPVGIGNQLLSVWNDKRSITYFPWTFGLDSVRREENVLTPRITGWFKELIEEWDTIQLRHLVGQYTWDERIRSSICDAYPEYTYLSRVVVDHDTLAIDTIQFVDPTIQGSLKSIFEERKNR